MRSVPEWIGAADDSRAPPRVLLRIFHRESGFCHISGRQIQPGEKWQAEHKIAIINGGQNRESNLFPALTEPHKAKTKLDLAEKSRIAKKAKNHFGANQTPAPTQKIKGQGFRPTERAIAREKRGPKAKLQPRAMFK